MITKRVTNFISILIRWFLHVNNITFMLLLELDIDLFLALVTNFAVFFLTASLIDFHDKCHYIDLWCVVAVVGGVKSF